MTRPFRMRGLRRLLLAGAFTAASWSAAPALAGTLGYYEEGPPVVVQEPTTEKTTTTTTTYTETAPAYVQEREHERDREHGAGVHLDTPIFNFGIGIH